MQLFGLLLLLVWIGGSVSHDSKFGDFQGDAGEVLRRLKSAENHDPRPPVIFIPGVLASRMVAWKKKRCIGPNIEIQDVVWLNLQKLVETLTFDKHCWLDCMKLERNGSDPLDCKIRPDEGLSAVGELSPGNLITPSSTSIFTLLIRILAHELGYDSNNIIAAPYDWRLSPKELERRDSYFTTLKFKIETAVNRHGRPSIIIAHSMGNNMFMYFCDWLRLVDRPAGGWKSWLRRHVWSYVGYAAPLLGSGGALKAILSGHTFGLPISDAQARELLVTFPSTLFLNPRSPRSALGLTNSNSSVFSRQGVVYEYEEPLVTIKSSSGSSTINFGIKDVESGDLYKWAGDIFHDPLLSEQLHVLQEHYRDDPLQPLSAIYRRPPIRHVMMVYGVDLPTESSYLYRTPDPNSSPVGGTATTANGGTMPSPTTVLEELYMEDSSHCANLRLSGKHSSGSSKEDPSLQRSNKANEDSATCSMTTAESSGPPASQAVVFRQAINLLNKHAHLLSNGYLSSPEGSRSGSSSSAAHQSTDNRKDEDTNLVSNEESLISETTTTISTGRLIDLDSTEIVQDEDIFSASYEENAVSLEDDVALSPTASSAPISHNGTELTAPSSSSESNLEEKVCHADIYALKPNKRLHTRTYVRSSALPRSGDTTVPYVSLSFAKTWLDEVNTGEVPGFQPDDANASMMGIVMNYMLANQATNEDNHLLSSTPSTAYSASSGKTADVQDADRQDPMAPEQWTEHKSARIHNAKHVLDNWTQNNKVIDPAIDLFHARHWNGDTTVVMEVSGVDHLVITKDAYVFKQVLDHLLPKMHQDLCLESGTCIPYYDQEVVPSTP